jgi:hypothetical protein
MSDSFEDIYVQYKELSAKMDEVESLKEKSRLFRQLSGLLAAMESALAPGAWNQK